MRQQFKRKDGWYSVRYNCPECGRWLKNVQAFFGGDEEIHKVTATCKNCGGLNITNSVDWEATDFLSYEEVFERGQV